MRRLAALALVAAVGCGDRHPAPPPVRPTPAPVTVVAPPPPAPDPVPPAVRIGPEVVPTRCALDLTIVPDQPTLTGKATIELRVAAPTPVIWLNAIELTVARATINGAAARVVPGNSDVIGFTTGAPIPAGAATIEVEYTAPIARTKAEGVYAEPEAGEWYAYTFFEATDARRAFPSFDQPDAKIPWQLTFHVKADHVALANAAVTSETPEPDGMKKVVIAESRPMPSYLVAFVIGPFAVVDGGTAGRIQTPVRFIVPKGREAELRYARAITPKVVAALEDYFDMDYPYGKLDVAVPPRYWGTMEHPGIVAMGQPLTLIKPGEETRDRKMAYTNILAHELAHYWFGDLVTLRWWDDTWLNESLGEWMDAIITDKAEPEWKFLETRHDRGTAAMNADEKLTTKSIRQPVETKEDIQASFDGAITYFKGQSVLHMFESWVGPDTWRDYIRAYVTKYAWKNATADDFLGVMTEMLGAPVATAFRTFLDQPGVPLISHTLSCTGTPTLALRQRRAFPLGTSEATPRTWQIPVCARYGAGKEVHRTCTLLTAAEGTLPLEGGCPTWITMNADAVGYYRSSYTAAEATALLGPKSPLSMPERSMVIADLGAGVDRGELEVADTMAMGKLVIADRDERLRSSWRLTGPLRPTELDDATYAKYQKWVLATVGPSARKLGWRRKKGDSDNRQALRISAVASAAYAGDRPLIAEAKKLARAWLQSPAALEDDIVDAVLMIAARNGDAALYDQILAAARATKDRNAQGRLLRALGHFRDAALVERTLKGVGGTEFDPREAREALGTLLSNRETREVGWAWVQANVDALLGAFRADETGVVIAWMSGMFCDQAHRDQAHALFVDRVAAFEGAKYALDQGLEVADQCIAAQARVGPGATKFLATY